MRETLNVKIGFGIKNEHRRLNDNRNVSENQGLSKHKRF